MIPVINRSVVLVLPKSPYADWALGLDNDEPLFDLEQTRAEPVAFLVDENLDGVFEPSLYLQKHWQQIANHQFSSWSQNESTWPYLKSFAEFEKWFEYLVAEMAYDLGVVSLERDSE